MCAVVSLHPSFRLGRTGGDDTDSQLRAHAPKLRYRYFSTQLLLGCRLLHVYVLPVRIQGLRNAVFTHPFAQHRHRRPDRLCLAEERLRPAGRIIDHVHQKALGAALLKPSMLAAIELHQFLRSASAVPVAYGALCACADGSISLLRASSAVTFPDAPQAIITAQMLSRQRR